MGLFKQAKDEKGQRANVARDYIAIYIDSSHFLFIHVVGYHKYCKLTLIRRKLGHTPLIHMYSVCETDLLKHYAAALFGDVVCYYYH